MRVRTLTTIFALATLAVTLVGCGDQGTTAETTPKPETTKPETQFGQENPKQGDAPVAQTPPKDTPATAPAVTGKPMGGTAADGATEPKAGADVAVMETTQGRIILKFFPEVAPRHVKNFISLANKKFYDGTRFHRIMPNFMIQGGDPNTKSSDRSGWGGGGPGYQIAGEMNAIPHTRGILSMARTADPDSAGSQFFITVADVREMLDPVPNTPGREGYTVFGQVVKGMDVVDKIVHMPAENELAKEPATIKSVRIAKWPVK